MYFTQYVTVKIAKMSIVLFALWVLIDLDMHFEREFLQLLRYLRRKKENENCTWVWVPTTIFTQKLRGKHVRLNLTGLNNHFENSPT